MKDTTFEEFKDVFNFRHSTEKRMSRDPKSYVVLKAKAIVEKLIDKEGIPNKIIDAGCGGNMYKETLPNIIGIDPINDFADIKSTILEANIEKESADIVMALGSINYINREYMLENFAKLVYWTKPNKYILVRLVTRRDVDDIIKCDWTSEMLEYITQEHNLEELENYTVNSVKRIHETQNIILYKKI